MWGCCNKEKKVDKCIVCDDDGYVYNYKEMKCMNLYCIINQHYNTYIPKVIKLERKINLPEQSDYLFQQE